MSFWYQFSVLHLRTDQGNTIHLAERDSGSTVAFEEDELNANEQKAIEQSEMPSETRSRPLNQDSTAVSYL